MQVTQTMITLLLFRTRKGSAEILFSVSCQNALLSDDPIDYVVNCAGETKCGQTDPVYKEGIYKLSMNCAQQAAKLKVERYVEISAGNFNTSEKVCVF